MTLPPEWFERAQDIAGEIAARRGRQIAHYLQSNMIGYSKQWNRVLSGMFGGSVGSSMDFPNLHRRLKGGGGPEAYARLWEHNVEEAQEAGIRVGTISIPNNQTFELGAERFYSHFVDELGITEFQINTPFPGGSRNPVKEAFLLTVDRLGRFLLDLAHVWMERGFRSGVRIGPFDRLMDYFVHGTKNLLCIWRENCANDFVCIDPEGHIAQCDCWVASYPDFWYGNVFDPGTLTDLLRKSEIRRSFQERPGLLMQTEDCLECDYLCLCHGGCPVRAYTFSGKLNRKDPYCTLYLHLFREMEIMAARHLSMGGASLPAHRTDKATRLVY